MIVTKRVALNTAILPASIFGDAPFRFTDWSVELPRTIVEEISALLKTFLDEMGCAPEGTFFRIDAYFDPQAETISILELSTQYVDGWGIGLCLSRAAGRPLSLTHAFPKTWVLDNPSYGPEIELECREIALASDGVTQPRFIQPEQLDGEAPVYWYGWRAPQEERFQPAHGYALEDKINLLRLSRRWQGQHVLIPTLVTTEECAWEDLVLPVVFKNRRKNKGIYGNVAFSDTPEGQGKSAQRAYRRGEAVAQAAVEPFRIEGCPTQIEILCAGTLPITGYLLLGDPDTRVLNDRVQHGPLFFLP